MLFCQYSGWQIVTHTLSLRASSCLHRKVYCQYNRNTKDHQALPWSAQCGGGAGRAIVHCPAAGPSEAAAAPPRLVHFPGGRRDRQLQWSGLRTPAIPRPRHAPATPQPRQCSADNTSHAPAILNTPPAKTWLYKQFMRGRLSVPTVPILRQTNLICNTALFILLPGCWMVVGLLAV